MSLSYGLRSVSVLAASALNAINKPFISVALNIIRMFFLYIPFAYAGSLFFGLIGLFWGLSIASILAGLIAFLWARKII